MKETMVQPSEQAERAELVPFWVESSGSDYVHAFYRGVELWFSGLELEAVTTTTDSEGDTQESRECRFKGQWILCRTHRGIEFPVRIRENYQRRGKYRKEPSDVRTENSKFNEKFQILTDDPHSAVSVPRAAMPRRAGGAGGPRRFLGAVPAVAAGRRHGRTGACVIRSETY